MARGKKWNGAKQWTDNLEEMPTVTWKNTTMSVVSTLKKSWEDGFRIGRFGCLAGAWHYNKEDKIDISDVIMDCLEWGQFDNMEQMKDMAWKKGFSADTVKKGKRKKSNFRTRKLMDYSERMEKFGCEKNVKTTTRTNQVAL